MRHGGCHTVPRHAHLAGFDLHANVAVLARRIVRAAEASTAPAGATTWTGRRA
jgi:hypothetical protein